MGDGGANSRIYTVITELETLWNFVHVCFLMLRMSTSEIHHTTCVKTKLTTYSFKVEYRNTTST